MYKKVNLPFSAPYEVEDPYPSLSDYHDYEPQVVMITMMMMMITMMMMMRRMKIGMTIWWNTILLGGQLLEDDVNGDGGEAQK